MTAAATVRLYYESVTRPWRRATLESTSLSVLIGAGLFFGAPLWSQPLATTSLVSSDTALLAGVSPPSAAEKLLALAADGAKRRAGTQATGPQRFRVEVLDDQRLRLICRAASAERARAACDRAANDASASGDFRKLPDAGDSARLTQRALDAALPALLCALGWFGLRLAPRGRTRRPVLEPIEALPIQEWQRWAAPARGPAALPSSRPAPPHSGPAPRPVRINTVVGMPALNIGVNWQLPDAGIPQVIDAEVTPIPRARRAASSPADRSAAAHAEQDRARRVIYHVSNGRWVPDADVLNASAVEQLRGLVDQFEPAANGGCRVLRVCSAANSRYAKSHVATQLAWFLAARRPARTLLLEADLDAPALHRLLGVDVPRGFGFSEQLEKQASSSQPSAPTVLRMASGLHALVEARSGTPALFDTPPFGQALARLKLEHDLIVIDGPIVDTWPDSGSLRAAADRVVFVVAAGTGLGEALNLGRSHFPPELLCVVKTGDWPKT